MSELSQSIIRLLEISKTTEEVVRERKSLEIVGVAITDEEVKEICEVFPELIKFDINTSELTDAAAEYLGKLNDLEWLDISGNVKMTTKTIGYISNLKKLKWLDLTLDSIDDQAIPLIAEMESIEQLYLSATNITVRRLLELKKLKNIQTLCLDRSIAGNSLPVSVIDGSDPHKIFEFLETRSDLA